MNSESSDSDEDGSHGERNIYEMTFVCPPGSIETIAIRAAEIVLAQLGEARPAWLTLEEAATRYRARPACFAKKLSADSFQVLSETEHAGSSIPPRWTPL